MKIAVVAPSRGKLEQDVPGRVQALAPAGMELFFHPQCFFSHGHFAGTDEQRLAAFVEVANSPEYDAVWFARGGYGACRIALDAMPLLNDVARQKIYAGYSDIGFITGALYKNGIGKAVHAPAARDGLYCKSDEPVKRTLSFFAGATDGLEPSVGNSPVVAFNISVLAHLVATPIMPKLEGHVVMLEDVDEHLYAVDRSLFTIMNAPRMKGAAGIRLGRISKVPENDVPFGETPEEIVQRWCMKTGIPYLGRADIGHDADNKIVPFGIL